MNPMQSPNVGVGGKDFGGKNSYLKKYDIDIGEHYKIMFKDSYSGRIAKAVGITWFGDVTLEFKNGKRVLYHASWLEVC